jgi:hypothetical protein
MHQYLRSRYRVRGRPWRSCQWTLSWVFTVADENFLGSKHELSGVYERLDIESVVLLEELQQIETRQVTGRVIKVHVFTARVGTVNAAGVWRSMPAVNRRVELHARISTLPGGVGELSKQLTRFDGLHYFTALLLP